MFKLFLFSALVGTCVFGLFQVIDTAFRAKEEVTDAEKQLNEKNKEIMEKDMVIHDLEQKIGSLKEAYELKTFD